MITLVTVIDSGSDASIMALSCQSGIGQVPLLKAISTRPLGGHLLGAVTHQTTPIHVLMPGNDNGTFQLNILPWLCIPIILGYAWSCHYNPHQVDNWSFPGVEFTSPSGQCCSWFVRGPTRGPWLQRGFFSENEATSLPHYHTFDCTIDLQPGTFHPKESFIPCHFQRGTITNQWWDCHWPVTCLYVWVSSPSALQLPVWLIGHL